MENPYPRTGETFFRKGRLFAVRRCDRLRQGSSGPASGSGGSLVGVSEDCLNWVSANLPSSGRGVAWSGINQWVFINLPHENHGYPHGPAKIMGVFGVPRKIPRRARIPKCPHGLLESYGCLRSPLGNCGCPQNDHSARGETCKFLSPAQPHHRPPLPRNEWGAQIVADG